MLKYSREDEEEADYHGLKYMNGAGYPAGMITIPKNGDARLALDPTHMILPASTSLTEIQMGRYPQKRKVNNLWKPEEHPGQIDYGIKGCVYSVTYFENCLKRTWMIRSLFGLGPAQKDWRLDRATSFPRLPPSRKMGFLLNWAPPSARRPSEAQKISNAPASLPAHHVHFQLGRAWGKKMPDEALQALLRSRSWTSLAWEFATLGWPTERRKCRPGLSEFWLLLRPWEILNSLIHFQKPSLF
jgi:hypothetical protein